MNCEEYVINLLNEKEHECYELQQVVTKCNEEIKHLSETIEMYEKIFRKYGALNRFDSSSDFRVTVSQASYTDDSEKECFKMLVENFPNVPVKDYRDKTEESE